MQADRPLPLTAAEFRLLSALVRADGRVLTRELLLDALYGAAPADALDRTIDVHIGRLREKLGDDAERPRYIATVRGAGYRVVGPVSG
jgi:DNA-binding response OmpR family regulator